MVIRKNRFFTVVLDNIVEIGQMTINTGHPKDPLILCTVTTLRYGLYLRDTYNE